MKMKEILKLALGAGLFILDQSDRARKSVRERVSEGVDDLRDLAHDKYEAATDNFDKATRALRHDDNSAAWNVLRFAVGVGIGVGVGLLVAPANGEETRAKITGKAHEFGDSLRGHFVPAYRPTTASGD